MEVDVVCLKLMWSVWMWSGLTSCSSIGFSGAPQRKVTQSSDLLAARLRFSYKPQRLQKVAALPRVSPQQQRSIHLCGGQLNSELARELGPSGAEVSMLTLLARLPPARAARLPEALGCLPVISELLSQGSDTVIGHYLLSEDPAPTRGDYLPVRPARSSPASQRIPTHTHTHTHKSLKSHKYFCRGW